MARDHWQQTKCWCLSHGCSQTVYGYRTQMKPRARIHRIDDLAASARSKPATGIQEPHLPVNILPISVQEAHQAFSGPAEDPESGSDLADVEDRAGGTGPGGTGDLLGAESNASGMDPFDFFPGSHWLEEDHAGSDNNELDGERPRTPAHMQARSPSLSPVPPRSPGHAALPLPRLQTDDASNEEIFEACLYTSNCVLATGPQCGQLDRQTAHLYPLLQILQLRRHIAACIVSRCSGIVYRVKHDVDGVGKRIPSKVQPYAPLIKALQCFFLWPDFVKQFRLPSDCLSQGTLADDTYMHDFDNGMSMTINVDWYLQLFVICATHAAHM